LRQGGADITQGFYPTTSLSTILKVIQYGTSEKSNANCQGSPILRIGNIKDRTLDLSELKHVSLPQNVVQGLLLRDGDVLIIRTSGSRDLVGTCAVFRGHEEFVFASYLIRLRFDLEKVDPEFVSWFLNSSLGRQQVDAVSRQIMQNNINTEELRALLIPLPPLSVQKKIMHRVTLGREEVAEEREHAREITKHVTREIENAIFG
jgi:type I restriction enzyme S subunit